jgi:hypothetical protein
MAASLGSLVVSLGLNAVEFTTGLSRAEFTSQRAMRRIAADIDAVAKTVAIAGVAIAAFALKMGHDFIEAAANLDDMAEKTGASVEELSKLSQQAYISGTALETVETTLIQLSKHLQGSGEESKNTTRALAALGLEASELKNLDTAQALQKIAVELNKFEDGMGKAALATDLLGKAGAQALPFLKDIANDGALAATVTAKQAAEAEALGKEWRRLVLEAKNVGQAIALDIIPTLRNLIEQFKAGTEIAGGFWKALSLFGSMNPFRTAGESIKSLSKTIEDFAKTRDELLSRGVDTKAIDQQIAGFKKQAEFAKVLQRQEALALGGGDTPGELARMGGGKAVLNYKAAAAVPKPAGVDKTAQEAAAATERYQNMLVGLESQLRAVMGAETELQKVREKMAADKDLSKIPAAERQRLTTAIETAAASIDAAKALQQVNKGWVEHAEAVLAASEAEDTFNASLVKSPKELQALADSIKQTIDPTLRLKEELQALDDLVSQDFLSEADKKFYLLDSRIRGLIKPTQNLSDAVQQAWEANNLTNEEMTTAFNALNDHMDKAETGAKDFAHAIGTSFEDAILKGGEFKDILNGLLDDIGRIALRMTVTKPLESALEGAIGQGLPALLRGLGGGSGSTASMASSFANDGNVYGGLLGAYASGTDYVPRTGPYMLHQGEKVIPANERGGGGMNFVTNIDARGATQDAIPGIVAALNSHERALQRIVSHDAYKRDGATRQALHR